MNDRHAHAMAWFAKAKSDQLAAGRLLEAGGPYDAVCFHAQQACEKALKAVLAAFDAEIPRTHNLEELQIRCAALLTGASGAMLTAFDLVELTPYAVEMRYDAQFWPDRSTADAAVRTANQVIEAVSTLLSA